MLGRRALPSASCSIVASLKTCHHVIAAQWLLMSPILPSRHLTHILSATSSSAAKGQQVSSHVSSDLARRPPWLHDERQWSLSAIRHESDEGPEKEGADLSNPEPRLEANID